MIEGDKLVHDRVRAGRRWRALARGLALIGSGGVVLQTEGCYYTSDLFVYQILNVVRSIVVDAIGYALF